MRPVALVLAFLFALTWAPAPVAATTDECAAAGMQCVQFDVPVTPLNAQTTRYYLYAHAATCPQACSGTPPARMLGLLWEETNCIKGMQRFIDVNACGTKFDTPVLY